MSATWTVREIVNWTRGYFKKTGITQPRLEAEILLAHSLNVDRLYLYLAPDKPLTLAERERFKEVIRKRRDGVPLQLLTGEVSFFGLRFRVREEALIPRPETEELVEKALSLAPKNRDIRCLDLGTGTGVIAVCLAKFLRRAHVTAVDISPKALRLAGDNAELNGVADKIVFQESDWLGKVQGRFDLIVSNPPYIDEGLLEKLPTEVREHEPRVALNGGNNGTEQMKLLLEDVRTHMNNSAVLLLEIGESQATQVLQLVERAGLVEANIANDIAVKQRFVIATCP
ncbi:MAG: peptide chain release factor N(5)-glutamine methyltransferase [Candidatus Bipolaricaulota bacterium]